MHRGSTQAFVAALGLTCASCFNPQATDETSASSTAASTSTSTPTSLPTGDPPAITTTTDSCVTACGTTTSGATHSPDTTTPIDTTEPTTTGSPDTTGDTTTGTGNVGFVPFGTFAVPGALALANARLDADDIDDLVITNIALPKLSYIVSSDPMQVSSIGAAISFPVVTIDFNNDTKSEVVLGYYNNNPGTPGALHLRGGQPFPMFSDYKVELPLPCERPTSLDAGKLNDDDFVDFVVGCAEFKTGVYIVFGNVPEFNPPVALELGVNPTFARLHQVYDTPALDLVVTSHDVSKVLVFAGKGDGSFATIGALSFDVPSAASLSFGEVDGDAELAPDLVVLELDGANVWQLTGIKDNGFNPPAAIPCAPMLRDLTLGDFNGDGLADLATLHFDNHMRIALNTGNGAYASPTIFDIGPSAWRVIGGDYDGDGDLDIAATSEDRLDIFRNTKVD